MQVINQEIQKIEQEKTKVMQSESEILLLAAKLFADKTYDLNYRLTNPYK